jgi:signal peptidase I
MPTGHQGNTAIELACGLTEEVVRTLGEVRLRVMGTSMVPSILPGDYVTIQRANAQEISPGEVVLFLRNGQLILHRVVDRKLAATTDRPGESWLITRGDRVLQDDPPVSSLELLGRVVSIERGSRKVELPDAGSNSLFVRLLQSSDHATYLYLRFATGWRTLFLRRTKCQA